MGDLSRPRVVAASSQAETAARWQQELKRRIAARQVARAAQAPAVAPAEEPEPTAEPEPPDSARFRYEMGEAVTGYPRAVPVDEAVLGGKKLVRTPPKAAATKTDPRQKSLELDHVEDVGEPIPAATEPESEVDREVLFSRFLCGIIDLSLPVVTGFVFTIAGAWILDFDYFLSAALEWAAGFSVFFFFFNSLFFLLLMGQTPGMYVTELRLVSETDDAPSTWQVGLRVLLFLPSVFSVIGLAAALFDSSCRAVHDRLTATRVEALEQPSL